MSSTTHILTVHHNKPDWIAIQAFNIRRFLSNSKIWATYNGGTAPSDTWDYWIDPSSLDLDVMDRERRSDHAVKLNFLTRTLELSNAKPNDIVIWLDSDAFPLQNAMSVIRKGLSEYPFIAVQRPENGGELWPHPLFASTRVKFLRKHRLDWQKDFCMSARTENRRMIDVGCRIGNYFSQKQIQWGKLRATEHLSPHPVFFTCYGMEGKNAVYHHGAGSRKPSDRLPKGEKIKYNEKLVRQTVNDLWGIDQKIGI